MRCPLPRWTVLPSAALFFLSVLAAPSSAADDAAFTTLVDDVPAAIHVAAPATGQTLYVLDGDGGGVTAVDPFDPSKRWTAISPEALRGQAGEVGPGSVAPRPVAIGCIDSNTLAVVFRSENDGGWTVGTYRLPPPGSTTESALRLQTLTLGTSRAETGGVDLVVSPSRDWLAVVGLPAPMPPIVRAPVAGTRIGTFADRRCPRVPTPSRRFVATISPFDDEWVLFLGEAGGKASPVSLSIRTNAGGQELLRLDTRLTAVEDAAYCRESGTLWAVGRRDDGPSREAGLWRIDAVLENGRQAARAALVAKLEDPLSLVCLSPRAIAVIAGASDRTVVLVNPIAAASK
jgi:hypothetical protein